MVIGIITHNYPKTKLDRGDAGAFVYDFAHQLKKSGHEVFVLTPNFVGKKETDKKIPTIWFNWLGGANKLGQMRLYNPVSWVRYVSLLVLGCVSALKFIKEEKVDIIVSMWAFPAGFIAAFSKFVCKTPYVVVGLGSDIFVYTKFPLARLLVSTILKYADYRVGNSHRICREMDRMTKQKSIYIPMMTSLGFVRHEKVGLPKEKFNFLFVGRFEKIKGPDILIEAVNILKNRHKNFKIFLVGLGSMETDLKDTIGQYNIENFVEIVGPIYKKEKLVGYMREADSLVIPSRSESLPFVLVEAIHSGLPMIVTKVGDLGRIVRGSKIGYTTSSERPDLFATAMEKALVQGKKFRKSKQRALSQLKSEFSLENSVERFVNEIQN